MKKLDAQCPHCGQWGTVVLIEDDYESPDGHGHRGSTTRRYTMPCECMEKAWAAEAAAQRERAAAQAVQDALDYERNQARARELEALKAPVRALLSPLSADNQSVVWGRDDDYGLPERQTVASVYQRLLRDDGTMDPDYGLHGGNLVRVREDGSLLVIAWADGTPEAQELAQEAEDY